MIQSFAKHVFKFVVICVLALPSLSWSDDEPIERAGICSRLLSLALTQYTSATFDPFGAPYFWIKTKLEAKKVASLMASDDGERVFVSLQQLMDWDNKNPYLDEMLDSAGINWGVTELSLGQYGTAIAQIAKNVPISALYQHFEKNVPHPYSQIAVQTLAALLDYGRVRVWIKKLRSDVLLRMWNAGIRSADKYKLREIREKFLDEELAQRAAQHGFRVKKNGVPFRFITFNREIFLFRLSLKQFFVDVTGTALTAGSEAPHYARGHTLPLAYLAENVPNVASLVQYIGHSRDKFGIWSYLFDNAYSTQTPLWGGFWVERFKDYLNIRY